MMPETYTQEQIHNIATALYGWTALPRILPSAPGTGPDWDIGADIRAILSALSTAEQERDAMKAQVAEAAEWQELIKEDVLDVLVHNDIFGGVQDQIACILDRMPLPEPPAIVSKKEGL